MAFNEDSRVKIPTILHLIRLGYEYVRLKDHKWDTSSNIFTDIFKSSIKRLNPGLSDTDISRFYDEVSLCLENEDLGKTFYEKLTQRSGVRLIDLDNFRNNTLSVATELPCKKDDEEAGYYSLDKRNAARFY
jgi:type I restriction enzyme R subunit